MQYMACNGVQDLLGFILKNLAVCENTWRPNSVSTSQVVGTVGNNKKQGVKTHGAQFSESKKYKSLYWKI